MKYVLSLLESGGTYAMSDYSKTSKEIIDQIKETAFALCEESEVKLFIENHQRILLNLRDEGTNSYQCDEVLHYLETSFSKFLDKSQKVSLLSKKKLYDKYRAEILEAINTINKIVSADFLETVYPFLQVYGHSERTVERYLYQRNCMYKFLKFIQNQALCENDILDFFITHNFNHKPFVDFLKMRIKNF